MQSTGEYFNNKESIKSLLSEMGYNIQDMGEYLKCNAAHREGRDVSSMTIYPNSSIAIDHVLGEKYNLKYFFSKILNVKEELVGAELKNRNFNINFETHSEPKIKVPKIFDNSILNDLVPVYDYFLNRGIDKSVLEETKCGLYTGEIKYLKNRIVFPCFNSNGQITMVAGRDITGNNEKYKWILKGQKETVYPLFINSKEIINNKEIIITEGIGDVLSLFSCGIRNSICMFGTECGLPIINYLLKINGIKIILSTNNDIAGKNSAEKSYKRLSKYFGTKDILIKLPPEPYKDFNDCLISDDGKNKINEWYNNIYKSE